MKRPEGQPANDMPEGEKRRDAGPVVCFRRTSGCFVMCPKGFGHACKKPFLTVEMVGRFRISVYNQDASKGCRPCSDGGPDELERLNQGIIFYFYCY